VSRFLIVLAMVMLTEVSVEARITETSTSLGAYVLIEEVSALEAGETPIMHVNRNWTKLHLRFVTADKVAIVDVVDDGQRLAIEIETSKCFSTTWPVEYGNESSGASLHLRTEKAAKAIFKLCRTLTKVVQIFLWRSKL
jgi:hypothetical protein